MEILKHKGAIKIITQDPAETRHEVNEGIYQGFRYVFSDDLAVGEKVIQFSGRTWGLFMIINSSPLSLIDQGEIHLEESGHSVLITYSISYKQVAIMWTIIAVGMLITMLTLFLINIVPFFTILGPLLIFCMLAVMMGFSIMRFETLLEECLSKVKGSRIQIPI
jgi:hypothetical protein